VLESIHPDAKVSADVTILGTGRLIIEQFAVIESGVILDTGSSEGGRISIGSRAKIKSGSILRCYGGALDIGRRTSIGEFNLIASHGGVSIGSEGMFGPYVFINAASHIIEGTDHFRFLGETAIGISVGQGVWLGARSTVLDGVTIGDRSVIGAHSLVLDDVPSGYLAFGQPACIQRKIDRRDDEGIC
jgi:acetyltransferase-like isoleucine patch superfamily enzyme